MFRFNISIILCTAFCLVLLQPVHAFAVSAEAAVVIENSADMVIYQKNAYTRLPMASTTKIMTAICAIENTDNLDAKVDIPDEAIGIEGSSIYLAKGEKLSVRELLYGLMLNSGNDAATALAIIVSGSVENFASLMNSTAKRVGARDTNFVNPSGLYHDNHYTTAYDLAIISSYAMRNPVFEGIASAKTAKISNGNKGYDRVLSNHNKMLAMYEGCIGVKTGYTKKCGRCLVTCAERDGRRITCVTLNAPDDWNDHRRLLDEGFAKTSFVSVVSSGEYCMSSETVNAVQPYAKLCFESELSYVAVEGSKEKVSIRYDMPTKVPGGTKENTAVGEAKLYCGEKCVASSAILCKENVKVMPPKDFGDVFLDMFKICLGCK